MVIVIGADHGGYEYKNRLVDDLKAHGYEVIDVGAFCKESTDYPIFAAKVAENVQNKTADFGVIICTSGEGVCIAANKFKGIRCGIGYNDLVSKAMREHNHANVITFGATYMDYEDVLRRTIIFLNTKEEGGRHDRRVNLISDLEK